MKPKKFLHRIVILFAVILSFFSLVCLDSLAYQGPYAVKNQQSSYFKTNQNFNTILNETGFLLVHQLRVGQGKDYVQVYLQNQDETTFNLSQRSDYEILLRETLQLSSTLVNMQGIIYDKTSLLTRRLSNSSSLPQTLPDDEMDRYLFWMKVDYDAQGNQTIDSNIQGMTTNFDPLALVFEESRISDALSEEQQTWILPELKNVTFTFGIPSTYNASDFLGKTLDNLSFWSYYNASSQLISILLCTMFVFSLFFIGKKSRESQGGVWLNKIPLELRVIIAFFVLLGTSELVYSYTALLRRLSSCNMGDLLGCFILILCELIGIYACVFWVRCLFIDKLKGTLNHLTTVGLWKKGFYKIIEGYNLVRRWMHECFTINFSEKSHSRLVRIMLVNVILLVFLVIFFTPILGALLYTVILYLTIVKAMKHLKKDYEVLLSCTRRMAEGELDCEIVEQLGIFEPLKEELDDIRFGFKLAIEQETKSQKMKTELISNVSHDLKTPLTSLISFIDLLKSETDEDKRNEYIAVLQRNSIRLKHLIEDLFEVSKANSGVIKLDIVEIDLIALVSQTLFELAPQIEKAKLQVKTSFTQDKIVLPLDSQKTYRIVENLVSNAIKYSLPCSRMYVTIVQKDEEVIFSIKNISVTEIDFDPNDIMERFVRGDKSRNSEGSGLGLAIAKGFAEAQKASLKIETDGDFFKVVVTFRKVLETQLIELQTK